MASHVQTMYQRRPGSNEAPWRPRPTRALDIIHARYVCLLDLKSPRPMIAQDLITPSITHCRLLCWANQFDLSSVMWDP
jgi:hypothetical protein